MNEKRLFTEAQTENEAVDFTPKREFHGEMHVEKDEPVTEDRFVEQTFEHIVQPRSLWWKTGLALTALLFCFAVIAQSIQWLVDTWQQNQWIYFVFSLVTCLVVLLGVSSLGKEWLRLVKLKKRLSLQQKSQQILRESAVNLGQDFCAEKHQQIKALCTEMAQMLKLSSEDPHLIQWQNQLHDAYSAQEVAHLFSQTVLHPFDVQIKKLISKSALEAAVIVAVSPLAVIDMFFLSWRNIRLVNQIAQIYRIELGYWSRLRLLKMVLLNLAFAGATEVVQDIGLDWLSQDLTAKLSARAAQGIGVGLLTARLGIKAMEFCRPLAFQAGEKPRLNHIQQELLGQLKSTFFRSNKTKVKQQV
ncbi:TPA: TIGR01620 family protein [Pasteurella multocida]